MRPAGTYSTSYAQDMAIMRTRIEWIMLTLFLVFLIAFPHFSGRYWTGIFSLTGIILSSYGQSLFT